MLLLPNKTIDKLKHDLVRDGFISLENLTYAQEKAQKYALNLAEILIKEELVSEETLLNFIQDKLHVPYVNLGDYTLDPKCIKYLSYDDAKKYNILPLFKIEDVLTIAMADPLNLFSVNNLFDGANITVEPVVCTENSIRHAIEKYYTSAQSFESTSWQDVLLSANFNDDALKAAVYNLFVNAIDENSKNIFMERFADGLNVYYDKILKGFIPNIAVPGFLFELQSYTENFDISSDNTYKDGKFDFKYKNTVYSIIISCLPTKYGMRYALSIISPLKTIEQYGFSPKRLNIISEKPAFIGLNTVDDDVAYSLAQYYSSDFSVLMVANVIKYDLAGVCQVQTDKNTGIYFDEILKQIELQNFDMIFWEKIYTQDQFEKLKLLSKERTIITAPAGYDYNEFDFVIYSNGNIK